MNWDNTWQITEASLIAYLGGAWTKSFFDFSQNTILLITSDNGGVSKPQIQGKSSVAIQAGLNVVGPLRGRKHHAWERGFRVPYLVRWPGHVPAKTVSNETLSVVDTLAIIAAVEQPLPDADVGAEVSFNMLPAWLGQD